MKTFPPVTIYYFGRFILYFFFVKVVHVKKHSRRYKILENSERSGILTKGSLRCETRVFLLSPKSP